MFILLFYIILYFIKLIFIMNNLNQDYSLLSEIITIQIMS